MRLASSVEMFTVYGGFVGREDLAVGQLVRAWYIKCLPPKAGGRGVVAVLIVASTKPGEGWP